MTRGLAAWSVTAVLGLACSGAGAGNPFADAGTGDGSGSGGTAGSGHGGSAGAAGSAPGGTSGVGGSGQGGGAGCPPCVGPPDPACVGTGPCGCGPYECPDTLACPDGSSIGPFDRGCTTPDDCAVAYHQTDCCGTVAALGLARSAIAVFGAAEASCSAAYPACECPPRPISTEDGGEVTSMDRIVLECAQGECSTAAGG